MHKFFTYIILANGLLLFVLSLYILADIWILNHINSDIMGKVIGSYMLLLANFIIFYKLKELGKEKETDQKDD